MAGKRMKISNYDHSFAFAPLQRTTVDNWSHAVAFPQILAVKLRDTLNAWLDSVHIDECHFKIEAEDAGVVSHMLDDIAMMGIEREIKVEFKRGDRFKFNGAEVKEIMVTTGNNLGDESVTMPLLLIATHKVMIRRHTGRLWNLGWNITIAGCVTTTVGMGVAIEN